MDSLSTNEQVLSRYLLGQLSDQELAAVEERFLADDDYYLQLLVVEDELRCAYAQGSLPPREREQFEKRFLAFPEERQRVELARTMLNELSEMQDEKTPASLRRQHWASRFLEQLGFRNLQLGFAVAALIIALGTLAWLAFQNARLQNQIAQLEKQQSETEQYSAAEQNRLDQLNRQLEEERSNRSILEEELARREAPADRAAPPAIATLILSPGLLRSGGDANANRLIFQPDTAQIRLLLKLDDTPIHQTYEAVILNSEGIQVWRRAGLREGRRLVRLTIPANLLPEDDYEVNLMGVTPAGERERIAEYYFNALKK